MPAFFCSNPNTHNLHVFSADAPTDSEYFETMQSTHELIDSAAKVIEYLPLIQFWQSESLAFFSLAEYFPFGQFLQPSIEPSTSLYCPFVQDLQPLTFVVPKVSPHVP